jgi:hypothetical protein
MNSFFSIARECAGESGSQARLSSSLAWAQKVGSWVMSSSHFRSTAARTASKLLIQLTRARLTSASGSPMMMRSTVSMGSTQSAAEMKCSRMSRAVIGSYLASGVGALL